MGVLVFVGVFFGVFAFLLLALGVLKGAIGVISAAVVIVLTGVDVGVDGSPCIARHPRSTVL